MVEGIDGCIKKPPGGRKKLPSICFGFLLSVKLSVYCVHFPFLGSISYSVNMVCSGAAYALIRRWRSQSYHVRNTIFSAVSGVKPDRPDPAQDPASLVGCNLLQILVEIQVEIYCVQ